MNTPPQSQRNKDEGCRWLGVATLILAALGCLGTAVAYFFPFAPVRTSPIEALIEDEGEQLEQGIVNLLAEDNGLVWNAVFYSGIELGDSVLLQSTIKGARNGLRVDWGTSSPHESIDNDHFSALFSTEYDFNRGAYCFVIEQLDDGAKLVIDGKEIRSFWWGYTPGAVYRTPIELEEGPHTIMLKYFENFENSGFHLFWYSDAGPECKTSGHDGVQ